MKLAIGLIVFFGVVSCKNNSKKTYSWPVWQTYAASSFSFYPICYKKTIILPTRSNQLDGISGVNVSKGEIIWTIRDSIFKKIYYNFTPYIYHSLLVIPISSDLICIDMVSGRVVWRDAGKSTGENHVFGNEQFFFRTYKDYKSSTVEIYKFDIYTGAKKKIYSTRLANFSKALIRSPQYISEVLLSFSSMEIDTTGIAQSNVNIITDKPGSKLEKYLAFPLNNNSEGGAQAAIASYPFSYWVFDYHILKFDLNTRNVVWRKIMPHGLLTSKMKLIDGRLYYPSEDEHLYCINTSNGETEWKLKLAGTPGRLFFVTNKLYVVGGSNGILFEIDAQKGKILNKYTFSEGTHLQRVSFFSPLISLIKRDNIWYASDLNSLIE